MAYGVVVGGVSSEGGSNLAWCGGYERQHSAVPLSCRSLWCLKSTSLVLPDSINLFYFFALIRTANESQYDNLAHLTGESALHKLAEGPEIKYQEEGG